MKKENDKEEDSVLDKYRDRTVDPRCSQFRDKNYSNEILKSSHFIVKNDPF